VDDPFGINSTPAAPPAAASLLEPPPLIDSHCQKFFLKNSGVLHEDENLQIGIKMEFRERLGRVQLFYGNKSSSVDISSFKADVDRLKIILSSFSYIF
jgi:AP-2 complex subunit alpha